MLKSRICFLSSPGGHLAQLHSIRNIVPRENRFFVTQISKDSYTTLIDETAFFFNINVHKSNGLFSIQIGRAITGFHILLQSIRIISKNKFDYLVTTGASTGLVFCFLSWLLGKKIIFIETYAGITRFGKLLHLISYKTFVQWPSHVGIHPDSVLIPPLYNCIEYEEYEFASNCNFVYVSVGSTNYQFNRLFEMLDNTKNNFKGLKFIGQIGHSTYVPDFFSKKAFHKKNHMRLMNNCSIFITHGGSSNLWDSEKLKIKTIVVPRLSKFGETIDDHQLFLTEKYVKRSMAKVAHSSEEIVEAIKTEFNEEIDIEDVVNPIPIIIKQLETN